MSRMKLSDKLIAPSRGYESQVLSYALKRGVKRPIFFGAYLSGLRVYARDFRLDWCILVAQSAVECRTADGKRMWASDAWADYGNPAGLDVNPGNPRGNIYVEGVDAAGAHALHMSAYTYEKRLTTPVAIYLNSNGIDPVYERVFTAGYNGSVQTISDLGNGRWATDPDYAELIVELGNAIFGDTL